MFFCNNLLKRHRRNQVVFYCKKKNDYVDWRVECQTCSQTNYNRQKSLKKKTNKQRKYETSRYSIFTNNYNRCYNCYKEGIPLDLHEVWGGSNRIRSIKNGFVVPLCRECHSNEQVIMKLRKKLQGIYEEKHSREEFIQIIGKNYL